MIATGKHKNGIYHIAHVNSLHSNFKRWIKPLMVLPRSIWQIICIGLSGFKYHQMKKIR